MIRLADVQLKGRGITNTQRAVIHSVAGGPVEHLHSIEAPTAARMNRLEKALGSAAIDNCALAFRMLVTMMGAGAGDGGTAGPRLRCRCRGT